MIPKIDYVLLSNALNYYIHKGYKYVEAPWLVESRYIKMTLPDNAQAISIQQPSRPLESPFLVGSAEQSLISLDLKPDRYVAVTPCFRDEEFHDILKQPYFMKIELFDNRCGDDAQKAHKHMLELLRDAHQVMCEYTTNDLTRITTDIGYDLVLDSVEIGSYGVRSYDDTFYAYGTGLALPRFTVADKMAQLYN